MEVQLWQRCNWMVNALLVLAIVLIVAAGAWGLDTQDIVVQWTPEGKKLAMQRVARVVNRVQLVPIDFDRLLVENKCVLLFADRAT